MKREIDFRKSPFPLPLVMIGAGTVDKPNASLYIWFSQFNEDPPIFAVAIKKKRYTYTLIKETGDFSMNIPTKRCLKEADLVGTSTGRTIDKFKEYGLTPLPGKFIKAPLVGECPINIELKVIDEIVFPDHSMIIGEVLDTWIEEDLLKRGDKVLDIQKLSPIIVNYSDLSYHGLGEFLNFAGFSRRKK